MMDVRDGAPAPRDCAETWSSPL